MKPVPVHRDFTDDMRREDRFRVLFRARLREKGRSAFDINVINLSTSGFCGRTSYWLLTDARVWLTIPGLEPREARVIWQQDYVFGCEFIRPLHPAVFDHLARTLSFQ